MNVTEIMFKTGLCDGCYDSCERTCRHCEQKISLGQLGWFTGMCNSCYDSRGKVCQRCQVPIRLEELGWRTGICNGCYDQSRGCKARISAARLHLRLCDACYGHCNKTCARCSEEIPDDELRYSSGLCDVCYNECKKKCEGCGRRIPMKQLRWGSGLCDDCYNSSCKTCRMCHESIGLGQAYHGVRLCESCFGALDGTKKMCGKCNSPTMIYIGERYWGVGMCSQCFEGGTVHKTRSMDRLFERSSPLSRGSGVKFIYSAKSLALLSDGTSTPVSASIKVAFLLVGVSGWLFSNTVFAALPSFVNTLPEGPAVASLVHFATQFGAIFAMTYHIVQYNWELEESTVGSAAGAGTLSAKRMEIKGRRREKKAFSRAAKATHAGQAVAGMGCIVYALLWTWQQETWSLTVLSALAGAVGNVADLTVWPIALRHPSGCATAIQVGGSLSGLFASSLVEVVGPYGIVPVFLACGALQFVLWVAVCRVAGRPVLSGGGYVDMMQCNCAGCEGCTVEQSARPELASPLALPLLDDRFCKEQSCVDGWAAKVSGIVVKVVQFCQNALRGQNESSEEASSQVFLFTMSSFAIKAMCYIVPPLLPFMAMPYGARRERLFRNMNTMYNVGNLVGRMLSRVYAPRELGLLCSSALMLAAFLFIVLGSVCRSVVASAMPYDRVGWWALPLAILVFNLLNGLLSTGLFIRAHGSAQDGKCPKTLPATIGFYGQLGCVSGNVLVYLVVNVFKLL